MTLISGGVNYGTNFGSDSDQPDDPGGGAQWGQYEWFDPLEIYCSYSGTDPNDCAFWCNACEGQLVPTLVNTTTIDPTAPVYPSFTPLNISVLGICQIFEDWMWSVFWSGVTGNPENPPPIPPDPGNGPGVWG